MNTRSVRVSYVATGNGPALRIVDGDGPESGDSVSDGVLHVSDVSITLEFEVPGGGRSTLAWDPAEVGQSPLVA